MSKTPERAAGVTTAAKPAATIGAPGLVTGNAGKLEPTYMGIPVQVGSGGLKDMVQGRKERGGGGLLVTGYLEGEEVQLLVDTGASANLLSRLERRRGR